MRRSSLSYLFLKADPPPPNIHHPSLTFQFFPTFKLPPCVDARLNGCRFSLIEADASNFSTEVLKPPTRGLDITRAEFTRFNGTLRVSPRTDSSEPKQARKTSLITKQEIAEYMKNRARKKYVFEKDNDEELPPPEARVEGHTTTFAEAQANTMYCAVCDMNVEIDESYDYSDCQITGVMFLCLVCPCLVLFAWIPFLFEGFPRRRLTCRQCEAILSRFRPKRRGGGRGRGTWVQEDPERVKEEYNE